MIERTMVKIAEKISSTVTLNDGTVMPLFGLGVFMAESEGEAENAVTIAIQNGHRLIDTAAFYKNEADVGKAVKNSGLNRADLFVVTKLWNEDHGYEKTKSAFKDSMNKLDIGYVDLYLIHAPNPGKNIESYKAMLELKHEGQIRSVGVSNFGIHHIEGLKKAGLPLPSVNQIELHPWMRREEIVQYCRNEGITVMGYSPLARGQKFGDPHINQLAQKYNKSPGQIMIRWSVQNGFITIPKSVKEARIIENSQVFDWSIDEDDFRAMNAYKEESCCGPAWQPCTSPWID